MARPSTHIPVNSAALRHIRRITGVQQGVLAAEVGVSAGYLANLESGARQSVRPEVFAALCVALRVDDRRALMATPIGMAVG
jgi:transcriptional regulator with XRE-family HTH domain